MKNFHVFVKFNFRALTEVVENFKLSIMKRHFMKSKFSGKHRSTEQHE